MGSIRHFNDDDAAEIAGHIETLAGKARDAANGAAARIETLEGERDELQARVGDLEAEVEDLKRQLADFEKAVA